MAERDLLHLILSTWGAHPKLRIWRANTGVGWFANGQPARKTDPGAYPVKFGTPGQGDITGLIEPDGRRLEIECKAKTQQSDDQKSFQRMIERFGGAYVLARSLDDVDRALAALGVTRCRDAERRTETSEDRATTVPCADCGSSPPTNLIRDSAPAAAIGAGSFSTPRRSPSTASSPGPRAAHTAGITSGRHARGATPKRAERCADEARSILSGSDHEREPR